MTEKTSKETRGRKAGIKSLSPLEKMKMYTKNGHVPYNFNYIIHHVDQKKILENGWDLDIIDMAIFYQVKGFIDSGKAEKVSDIFGDWFFVCESKTIKDLPCVPINSKNAVYKRISKLVECGLIERNPTNRLTGKKFIRIVTSAYEKLIRNDL